MRGLGWRRCGIEGRKERGEVGNGVGAVVVVAEVGDVDEGKEQGEEAGRRSDHD